MGRSNSGLRIGDGAIYIGSNYDGFRNNKELDSTDDQLSIKAGREYFQSKIGDKAGTLGNDVLLINRAQKIYANCAFGNYINNGTLKDPNYKVEDPDMLIKNFELEKMNSSLNEAIYAYERLKKDNPKMAESLKDEMGFLLEITKDIKKNKIKLADVVDGNLLNQHYSQTKILEQSLGLKPSK